MKKNFWLVMLALLLTFGMAVVGCDLELPDDETDKRLNGTWISNSGDSENFAEIILNNGNMEVEMTFFGVHSPEYKGTYTTNGGKITNTLTHLYGGGVMGKFNSYAISNYFTDFVPLAENTWYTKTDILAKINAATPKDTIPDARSEAIADLDEIFQPHTQDYSINGDTLTLTYEDGEIETYTRKN